jgi:mRNA-degrading endonuclease YafQ of YafQ-DinJ toxin-antitoxin module
MGDPELLGQYENTLKLLETNPFHPSLRLHKLQGRLSELHSVSINIAYGISIFFFIIKKDQRQNGRFGSGVKRGIEG